MAAIKGHVQDAIRNRLPDPENGTRSLGGRYNSWTNIL